MENRVLVAYGTKYGATKEIAEKIGQVLRDAGLQADVRSVDGVNDLSQYRAVVLGSAVYAGQWRKDAANFLTANEKALAERPLWIFTDGPTGEGDPVELLKGWTLPDALKPVAERAHARDIAVFHGDIDANKVNLFEKLIIKLLKAPTGDFRDWDAITAWAKGIAEALKGEG